MAPEFLGKGITVRVAGVVRVPVSFHLGEREYVIDKILQSWADHSFGSLSPQRRRWWLRKHRNYYRVRTTEGEVFEIYYDRGTSQKHAERKKWFLYRKLDVQAVEHEA